MPHRQSSAPPASAFQSAQPQSGTARNAAVDTDRAPSRSPGSMLVWARPGPAAETQIRWTAALARGLGREVTLMDGLERSQDSSSSPDEESADLADRIERLQQWSRVHFSDIPTDLQARLTPAPTREIIGAAQTGRREPIVLWAPVSARLIRRLLRTTACTVLVLRAPTDPPELPWVGVAECDLPARPVARALMQGAQANLSLRQMPRLALEQGDDLPCRVACVSRPTPGWIGSHLLRRQRPAPATDGGVVEVYSNDNQVV